MEQFKEWWASITQREQQLVMASAVVLGIAILYWGIWAPLADQLSESKKQLTRAEITLNWTQKNSTVLIKSGVGKPRAKGANLTRVLNSSARTSGITFSRIVNKTDQVEVWIANVEFQVFLKWLTLLSNEHGVSVIKIDLSKSDQPGYIKVDRLLLGN